MSNVSNVHTVQPYVSGKSIALSGQRLAKATFKTDKETGKKPESKCVSIPAVTDAEIQQHLSKLLPAFGRLLDETQDKIVREAISEGKTEVTTESVSIEACISFLNSEATGNRLTKEFLETWFSNEVEEVLTVAVADKMGIGDGATEQQIQQVEKTVGVYKKLIAGLSGSKSFYNKEVRESVKKALNLVPNDSLSVRLIEKLDSMKEPEVQLFAL